MKNSPSLTVALFLCFSTLAARTATFTDTFLPGFNMIANHLNTGGNTLSDIFGTSLPDQTTVYHWDQAAQAYVVDIYDTLFGGWTVNGTLAPGGGAFLFNPTAAPVSYTYNGTALGAVTPVALPLNQFCVLSHQLNTVVPATFQDIVGSPPATGFCTRLYRWNRTLQKFQLFSSTGGAWTPSPPSIPQGESVFIIKGSADVTPPTLVNATISFAPDKILLEFSEPMHPTLAETLGNYVLSGGPGALVSASMYPITTPPPIESKFVQLNAVGLNNTAAYNLKISGLADLCGNLIDPCTQVGLNCNPPPNDACANATVAVAGPNPGTTVCATSDGYSACDGICPGPDVWFTYTPPCNGDVTFDTCGSPLDTIISVWNGCPTTLSAYEIFCDDDSCPPLQSTMTLNGVSSCETYYIRVSGGLGGAYGTFTLNVTFVPQPPANDLCANATVIGTGSISGNGVYSFDTCGALTDGPASPVANQDVWFRYTPTCNGIVFVSTCGSSFDTSLVVYSGTCGSLVYITNNNNATAGPCPATLQSYLFFGAVAGTTYHIRVGSPGAATGCGKLSVLGPRPPPGTCPPGIPSQGGTGGNVFYTRMFEVIGNSSGTPWAWSISAPCCYYVEDLAVPGVLPVGAPPSALVAAFVANINSKCPQLPALPQRLTAGQYGPSGQFMILTAWGCFDEIMFTVGPAGTLSQNHCIVPLPFNPLPTTGPCSFNPPIREIPLTKRDCNANGLDDLVDIVSGTSLDANHNRIPDECEKCARPRFVSKPSGQQVKPGQRAVFSAEAQGTGELAYQWLFNGAPLAGATERTLIIDAVKSTDEGTYRVVITNVCGQLRSAPVRLTLHGDALHILFRRGETVVLWEAPNVYLQSAPRVTGPWQTLSNAQSPMVVSPPLAQQFFRLIEK